MIYNTLFIFNTFIIWFPDYIIPNLSKKSNKKKRQKRRYLNLNQPEPTLNFRAHQPWSNAVRRFCNL